MANYLRDGIEWLHEQRHLQLSEALEYLRRAAATAIELDGTFGTTDRDLLIDQELFINSSVRDFIVRRADLSDAGELIEPESGDRITIVATGAVYEVCELGQEPAWRPSDEYDAAIRIHSRLMIAGVVA